MKKIMCIAAAAVLLSMCSCAEGDNTQPDMSSVGLVSVHSEDNGGISYDSVIEEIEGYCSSYISMNIEENEIIRQEYETSGISSEGGVTEVFMGTDNEPVRYRRVLYGAMGQTEENYYIIGDGRAYFTRLEKNYDTYHLERADILNYAFSEYWLADGKAYYLDRTEKKLGICSESPLPEGFPDISQQLGPKA